MDLHRLDPFNWFDELWFRVVGKPRNLGEKILYHIFEIIYAILVAVFLYSLLGFVLGTKLPIVVVASGSMIPTLNPGDVVILVGAECNDINATVVKYNGYVCQPYCKNLGELGIRVMREGLSLVAIDVNGSRYYPSGTDIVVYNNPLLRKDIIHRAVYKILAKDGCYLLTKGDNVPTLDQDCGIGRCIYPYPVKEIIGKVVFRIPYLGLPRLLIPF